jgi:hypothetical protein
MANEKLQGIIAYGPSEEPQNGDLDEQYSGGG